ncbi:MAG: hypothetical protein IPI91_18050 [Flavobacteriales bacterium]|nr:hypothetical protein [Flavobacteriales bacterium]
MNWDIMVGRCDHPLHIHNEMWLKEGPAEYTGHLVAEWVGGEAALVKAVKDNLSFILRQAHVNDGGYQALSPMPDPYIYGTHTYYKGAAVMHNLRGYLGDDVFRQAMRDIQADYASTTITSDGFKVALKLLLAKTLIHFLMHGSLRRVMLPSKCVSSLHNLLVALGTWM